jgi:hypothetical protein
LWSIRLPNELLFLLLFFLFWFFSECQMLRSNHSSVWGSSFSAGSEFYTFVCSNFLLWLNCSSFPSVKFLHQRMATFSIRFFSKQRTFYLKFKIKRGQTSNGLSMLSLSFNEFWNVNCSLGSVSTLTEWIIIIFQLFFNLKLLNFPLSIMIYCHMNSEIIDNVAYYMIILVIFNMSTSYFHKKSFHYFEDYLMTKLTLR